MALIGWYAIVPLALASLLTGLVMSPGTKWGLIRHYGVLISFVLTVFAVTILLLHMPDVSALEEVERRTLLASLGGLGRPPPPRSRPVGVARDPGAQCVQAAGADSIRVA